MLACRGTSIEPSTGDLLLVRCLCSHLCAWTRPAKGIVSHFKPCSAMVYPMLNSTSAPDCQQCRLCLQASVCMQRGALRDLLRNPAIDIDIEMALIILKDICIAMKVTPEGERGRCHCSLMMLLFARGGIAL